MALLVVEELRRRGHDVTWVRTDFPGASDDVVLARALAEKRLLITFDKDFGDLVFHKGSAASCGVVLFRLRGIPPTAVALRVADALESRSDWVGCFSVIDASRIRMVPLKSVP